MPALFRISSVHLQWCLPVLYPLYYGLVSFLWVEWGLVICWHFVLLSVFIILYSIFVSSTCCFLDLFFELISLFEFFLTLLFFWVYSFYFYLHFDFIHFLYCQFRIWCYPRLVSVWFISYCLFCCVHDCRLVHVEVFKFSNYPSIYFFLLNYLMCLHSSFLKC